MRTAALAPITALALTLIAQSTITAEIAWQGNLRTAHAQAEQEGKLLLLHFFSDNCVWCDRLEAGSFRAPQVSQAIGQGFVPVKINASEHPEMAEMFKVTKFPTDVVVTTSGKKLSHKVSPQDPGKYVEMLTASLQSRPAATTVAKAAPAPASPQVASPQDTPTYAAVTPQPQSGGITMPETVTAQTVSAAPQADARSQLAGYKSNEFAMDQPAAAAAPETTPPSAEPELAMEGFCAVTVISEDRWVEGKPEFGVIHLGKLYLFQNEAAMNTFLADPIPYTPVLNEVDVVRFFEERKIVPGKREWGVKDPNYQRMFFFADEAAMTHFIEEHHRYTDAAVEVMEQAVKDANPES